MPRCPTRSSLCTEPGRSTITTRRAPAALGVKVRWPGPPPVQSPRWRSAACTTVSGSTGPATIRCAVPGPQCVAWKVRTSSRVRASTVSGVPADRRRYGVEASNRWRRNISSARRPGSARACRMSARRSAFSRSNSPGSSRGSRTISASSAMPSSACSGSDWKAARAESQLDSLLTSMPSRSVASAKAPASRRRVPVTSSWAVSAATPACASSSAAAPASTSRCTLTTAALGTGTVQTVSPLGSRVRWKSGKWYGRGAPATGRSGLMVAGIRRPPRPAPRPAGRSAPAGCPAGSVSAMARRTRSASTAR